MFNVFDVCCNFHADSRSTKKKGSGDGGQLQAVPEAGPELKEALEVNEKKRYATSLIIKISSLALSILIVNLLVASMHLCRP